jgi:hypothetical protein
MFCLPAAYFLVLTLVSVYLRWLSLLMLLRFARALAASHRHN